MAPGPKVEAGTYLGRRMAVHPDTWSPGCGILNGTSGPQAGVGRTRCLVIPSWGRSMTGDPHLQRNAPRKPLKLTRRDTFGARPEITSARPVIHFLPLHNHSLLRSFSRPRASVIFESQSSWFSKVNMDRGTVSSLHVYPREETDETNLQVQKQLETFILEFRLDNVFVYRYDFVLLPPSYQLANKRNTETNFAKMRFCKITTATSTSAT